MHEFMYQHEAVRFFLDEDTRPSDANNALLFGLAAGALDLLRALWSDTNKRSHKRANASAGLHANAYYATTNTNMTPEHKYKHRHKPKQTNTSV